MSGFTVLLVVSALALVFVLGMLCHVAARTLRLQRRASRQLRLSREMRRTFEEGLGPMALGDLRASA